MGVVGGVIGAVGVPLVEAHISKAAKITSLPAKLAIQSGMNLGIAYAAHKMKQRALAQGVLITGATSVASVGLAKLITPKAGGVKGLGALVPVEDYPRIAA